MSEKKSRRGFAAMDREKHLESCRKGGRSQGKHNNPGNFANRREDAVECGRIGGSAKKHRRV